MPELPPELIPVMTAMAGNIADDLFESWHRGVCDGMEITAKMVEGLVPHTDGDTLDLLKGLANAVRTAQMRVQLDGLDPWSEK
jgi:hypothetical protein